MSWAEVERFKGSWARSDEFDMAMEMRGKAKTRNRQKRKEKEPILSKGKREREGTPEKDESKLTCRVKAVPPGDISPHNLIL
jgi:hypothetical protein